MYLYINVIYIIMYIYVLQYYFINKKRIYTISCDFLNFKTYNHFRALITIVLHT